MNLKDIISNIDISKNEDKWIDIKTIGDDLSLNYNQINDIDHNKNEFLRSTFIKQWLCSDTMVGVQAVFFKNEFVCLLKQDCRKCDKDVIGWVSQEKADIVREYLLSLVEEDDIPGSDILDMKEDFGAGYSLVFVGQIVKKDVFYNDEAVTIIENPRIMNSKTNFHRVRISYKNNEKEWVDVRDLIIPWKTIKEV